MASLGPNELNDTETIASSGGRQAGGPTRIHLHDGGCSDQPKQTHGTHSWQWCGTGRTVGSQVSCMDSNNTLRLRQDGSHFPDIFKCIFLNENVWISIKFSLKFVPKGPINSIPALVRIMAWHWSGNKPLSEPMMVGLLTHICVSRPQWVNDIHVLWIHYDPFAIV